MKIMYQALFLFLQISSFLQMKKLGHRFLSYKGDRPIKLNAGIHFNFRFTKWNFIFVF